MNSLGILVISFYVVNYLVDTIVDILNLNHVKEDLPKEFEGVYSQEKYKKSQQYLKVNTKFGLVNSTLSLVVVLGFIFFGGFEVIDQWARGLGFSPIITGLLFYLGLTVLMQVFAIPFSIYKTFVIEKDFEFNKITPGLFVADFIKSFALSLIIGGIVLYALLWFFYSLGSIAWLVAWGFMTIFQLVMVMIGPTLIMPLFNKFKPLEEGELKSKIESYADSQSYTLNGIFTMDGSKRSTKSNAYFTGLGKTKRIVLFDTLIEKHAVDGLVAVIAHEMGHYKKGHIVKMMLFSTATSGFLLFLLSKFMKNPALFEAFGMTEPSIYGTFVLFSFLFIPIQMVLGVISSLMSRKHEFEADEFAVKTSGDKHPLIQSLKTLSVDNLSNLTPHPLKVFLEYSHPPVLKRIEAINKINLEE